MYFSRPPCSTGASGSQARVRERALVGLEVVEVGALDAAVGAGEAQLDDLVVQADDLEQLRAAVARDRRDAHLRHDLEQALADAAPVAAAELGARLGAHADGALAHQVEQRLVGEVRIDRGRAVADQAREMMRIARRAGLDQDVALAAQAGLHQPVMHRAGGEQRMDRHLALHQVAVGQQQHQLAGAHRRFGLVADRSIALGRGSLDRVLQVDELVRDAELLAARRSGAACAATGSASSARSARRAAAPARRCCTPGRSASAATSRSSRAADRSAGS